MKKEQKKLLRTIILIFGCLFMKIGANSNVNFLHIVGIISAIITMIIGFIIVKECIEEWKKMKGR